MDYRHIDKTTGQDRASSRGELLRRLEGAGYYAAGTVKSLEAEVLRSGQMARAQTPWAVFEIHP